MSEINEGAVRQYGWSAGGAARLLFVVGVTFSAFQIVTASFSPLSSSIVRAVHVGFLLFLAFGLFRGSVDRPLRSAFSWLLAVTGFVLAFYHWIYEGELIQRAGDPTTTDLFVGGIPANGTAQPYRDVTEVTSGRGSVADLNVADGQLPALHAVDEVAVMIAALIKTHVILGQLGLQDLGRVGREFASVDMQRAFLADELRAHANVALLLTHNQRDVVRVAIGDAARL